MADDQLEALRLRDRALGEDAERRAADSGQAAPAGRPARRPQLPAPLRRLRIRLLERRARRAW